MVYTRIPKLLAISAAVNGEISPLLLVPSVNKMITFDFALLSFRRVTAFATPIPTAVPSSIRPHLILWIISSNTAWSTVSGHWVNVSPANRVIPILSFGRPLINSAATSLAASSLFGFKSSASILVDTSIASIISIPSISLFCHLLVLCGRANTTIIKANAMTRSINGACSK